MCAPWFLAPVLHVQPITFDMTDIWLYGCPLVQYNKEQWHCCAQSLLFLTHENMFDLRSCRNSVVRCVWSAVNWCVRSAVNICVWSAVNRCVGSAVNICILSAVNICVRSAVNICLRSAVNICARSAVNRCVRSAVNRCVRSAVNRCVRLAVNSLQLKILRAAVQLCLASAS